MASNWIIRKDVELTRIGSIDPLTNVGYIYKADNQAHVWEAHLYKDGQPATLTGYSARGYFIRSDGSTIAVSGSISGNVASVTFNNSCYAYKGLLKGALRLEKTNEIITVAALYAIVEVAATDTVVINTETEPDVEEILAELDTAITNAQEAASELSTAIEDKAVIYTGAQDLTEAQKQQARTNIGATAGAVRYDAEQSLTDAQKSTARGNIGAVSSNQGSANEGFALMVGPGGNVVPAEAGLSEATKTALLNIFQHVAYTDAQGQTYYDALYAALYASAYPRIGATFDPGSNTIYVDEGLSALKQYMVVKVYEDAEDEGTVVASTDYTLTGTLADGNNIVVVGYDGMVASVQVEAVDFYNQLEWTYPGNLQIDTGTLKNIWGSNQDIGTNHTEVPQPSQKWFDNFRHGYVPRGLASFYQEPTKFPVPIPQNATSVTLAITPADNYIHCVVERYDNGKYTFMSGGDSGWQYGEFTFNLTPYTPKTQGDEKYFLCIYAKHTSASDGGSAITVSGISVTFSTT